MTSLILNEKGAVAYWSTFSSLIDLFSYNIKDVSTLSYDKFSEIMNSCELAYQENPNKYLSLLAYRRSVKNNGQKMMYYIMMYIIRLNHPDKYIQILEWSHVYKKDLLRMSKIYQTESQPELTLYANTIFNCIENNVSSDMCFKYIGTSHFEKENRVIKEKLNERMIENNLTPYTNATLRKFYSSHKEKLNLPDSLLQGKTIGDNVFNEEYVVSYLKKLSAVAFKQTMKTISNFSEATNYKKVLYNAHEILKKEMSENKFSVKSHGMNPVKDCYQYQFEDEINPVLESMLTNKLNSLLTQKTENTQNTQNIDLVIDISMSMDGEPVETAFYIALMLHKLYQIDSAVLFSDSAKRVYISGTTWKETISSFYTETCGSTNLHKIFPYLENNNNLTIILTDADCDPVGGLNPFQIALRMFPQRSFLVWNVSTKKLCFPYSSLDKRVGYISGNEVGVMDSVFKQFSSIESPIQLLNSCLDEFVPPCTITAVSTKLTENQKTIFYDSIKKNIPDKNKDVSDRDIDSDSSDASY